MSTQINATYVLKCRGGTLYTGWTNDMKKRYEAHLAGRGGKYTRSHPPLGIAYIEVFETKEEAMRREYAIKKMTRAEKEAMIRGSDWRAALPETLTERIGGWL